MDDPGFFAVLIPRKTVTEYTLVVAYDNGTTEEIQDPYAYGPQFKEEELKSLKRAFIMMSMRRWARIQWR